MAAILSEREKIEKAEEVARKQGEKFRVREAKKAATQKATKAHKATKKQTPTTVKKKQKPKPKPKRTNKQKQKPKTLSDEDGDASADSDFKNSSSDSSEPGDITDPSTAIDAVSDPDSDEPAMETFTMKELGKLNQVLFWPGVDEGSPGVPVPRAGIVTKVLKQINSNDEVRTIEGVYLEPAQERTPVGEWAQSVHPSTRKPIKFKVVRPKAKAKPKPDVIDNTEVFLIPDWSLPGSNNKTNLWQKGALLTEEEWRQVEHHLQLATA